MNKESQTLISQLHFYVIYCFYSVLVNQKAVVFWGIIRQNVPHPLIGCEKVQRQQNGNRVSILLQDLHST